MHRTITLGALGLALFLGTSAQAVEVTAWSNVLESSQLAPLLDRSPHLKAAFDTAVGGQIHKLSMTYCLGALTGSPAPHEDRERPFRERLEWIQLELKKMDSARPSPGESSRLVWIARALLLKNEPGNSALTGITNWAYVDEVDFNLGLFPEGIQMEMGSALDRAQAPFAHWKQMQGFVQHTTRENAWRTPTGRVLDSQLHAVRAYWSDLYDMVKALFQAYIQAKTDAELKAVREFACQIDREQLFLPPTLLLPQEPAVLGRLGVLPERGRNARHALQTMILSSGGACKSSE